MILECEGVHAEAWECKGDQRMHSSTVALRAVTSQ